MARDERTVKKAASERITDRSSVEGPAPTLGLVVFQGETVSTFPLPAEGDVTIGRSREADVQIDADSLSRKHAALQLGATLRIKDLGSSNGTKVRNVEIGTAWVDVAPGDVIELGDVTAMLQRNTSVKRRQRIWSHGAFEARLEEECLGDAPFALVRVHAPAPKGQEAAPSGVLAAGLQRGDCLAVYAPGEYELLLGMTDEAVARTRADELVERLERVSPEARVGLACFPRDGRDADGLLARACAALVGRAEPLPARVVVASAAMKPVYELIDRIAPGTISVLIIGETGVGKEVVAEAIHKKSPRRKGTFLRINCAAFTETLLESELFGHEKGSFTGANEAKMGLLESANGGTVFLDEVGEVPAATQSKLLRVLEERAVRRVGSLKSRSVDVRFVAATNRNLEEEVAAGRFRRDLYFRIAGVTLVVPPLRDRLDELEPLARSFLAATCSQLGRPVPRFTAEVLSHLARYSWPGNLRELRNVMERAALLCGGSTLTIDHLLQGKQPTIYVDSPSADVTSERSRIIEALSRCGGNQTRAAKMLNISRRTLLYRLDELKIPRPQKQVEAGE